MQFLKKIVKRRKAQPVDSPATPHPDQQFGCRTYAQHGDDLVALALFTAMGISRPSYIDIGAHHPFNISNTALLYSRGSRGVNVEANPNLSKAFRDARPDDVNLNVGVAGQRGELTFYMIDAWSGRNTFDKSIAEAFVRDHPQFKISATAQIPVITVQDIIEKHCGGIFPDFLTLDVEGLDEEILRSISYEVSAPKVICVETVNAGGAGSGRTIKDFLVSKGYFCVMRCGANSIFVQNQYRDLVC
jgi:FkbM family methyltransferase